MDYVRGRFFGGLVVKSSDMPAIVFTGCELRGTSHWHSCPDMNFIGRWNNDLNNTKVTLNYCVTMALAHIFKFVP